MENAHARHMDEESFILIAKLDYFSQSIFDLD